MLTSGPGKFLAPTSLGAGYAIAKMLSLRALDAELAIAQDFFYQFLAGVLLGFALRPVASMIYWKRLSSIIVFSLFLITLGPLGQTFRHLLWGTPLNDAFWSLIIPQQSSGDKSGVSLAKTETGDQHLRNNQGAGLRFNLHAFIYNSANHI